MSTKICAAAAAVGLTAALFTPAVAHAGGGNETIEEGACSGAANWKMKLAEQNGRIEVEYEIDVNRRGQQWRVVLFHNGRRVLRDTFTTRGLSGSFEARSLEADRAGNDRFRGRAVRVRDGQTCGGRAVFSD